MLSSAFPSDLIYSQAQFDELVKTIFSRTSLRRGYTEQEDAKDAKKYHLILIS